MACLVDAVRDPDCEEDEASLVEIRAGGDEEEQSSVSKEKKSVTFADSEEVQYFVCDPEERLRNHSRITSRRERPQFQLELPSVLSLSRWESTSRTEGSYTYFEQVLGECKEVLAEASIEYQQVKSKLYATMCKSMSQLTCCDV
eukprot:CAMPEP_0184740524 /NCGR_PEP_ID=MMETSP0315-20130426/3512_1 /TAXON_ID=101924 /ORGANISM="Rhodosorus marinus, Strain UTEX LB 2760" /LENGTH=143 /DNA_ID=CAMNT_0027210217 /DNA_START=93 /DNA_END=521 /DNA_ORIENTATION=+